MDRYRKSVQILPKSGSEFAIMSASIAGHSCCINESKVPPVLKSQRNVFYTKMPLAVMQKRPECIQSSKNHFEFGPQI